MRYFLFKSMRVRTRRHYQYIGRQATRHIGQWIIIEAKKSQCETSRLGITVTRRYGNAALRNRFKRIVREAFRLNQHRFTFPYDINVKPRTASQKCTSHDISLELMTLLS